MIAHLHGQGLLLGRCYHTIHEQLQRDRKVSVYCILFGSMLKLSNSEAVWVEAFSKPLSGALNVAPA